MKQIEAMTLGSYNEGRYRQRGELDDPRFVRVIDIGIVKRGGGSCSKAPTNYLFTGVWEYPGSKTLERIIESRLAIQS